MKPMKQVLFYLTFLLLASCGKEEASTDSYLNSNLEAKKRTELLLAQMTLEEKVGQMCQYVGEPSKSDVVNKDEEVRYLLSLGETADLVKQGKIGSFLKVPTYKEANYLQQLAEQSRLKIPLLIATDAIHGHGMYQGATTIYPTEIGLASTFDTALARKMASYTASEMRATGYHWTFSPNIEVVRDPRWGRTGESFGEDPLLITELGKAMIKGYQSNGFGDSTNVIACAKHFVGGGIAYNGLNGAAADVSERTLHEVFFPPFIEAINAGVYTIMPAHNEINGVPCHAHPEYLQSLIQGEWGYEGFYVSDWMDIERLETVHRVVDSEKEAAKLAVLSGLDMHMQGPGFFDHVLELVNEGSIPEEIIDKSARKILYAKFQLGLFENRYADSLAVENELLKEEHRELALEIAQKSIVLLKNKDDLLPLSKNVKSIFVTGPNANNQAMLGDWSRIQPEENITTVLEGIKRSISERTKLDYLQCNSHYSYSANSLSEATRRAKNSDIAIVVVGDNSIRFDKYKTSGENLDRSSLELPGEQLDLVKAVVASGTPVVVVLINGAPITSPWTVEHIDGLIEAWEPGMAGGQAIADVLFGNINPSGRLPITIPQSVGHIQSFYNHKPSAFHRGRFYQSSSEPLFEFGFGLSYTNFKYSNIKVDSEMEANKDVELSFTLENTGEMDGDELVLVYLNDIVSSVTTPVKKLAAFKRVPLKAGESQYVNMSIPIKHFKLFNKNMDLVLEPGEFEVIVGQEELTVIVNYNASE